MGKRVLVSSAMLAAAMADREEQNRSNNKMKRGDQYRNVNHHRNVWLE